MSIQEHLNKIRNAVYGHEVRESIAKGIETAYDDASENGNANMEVEIARGTHPTLRDRLNKVDNTQQQNTAQLQQKADLTYVDNKIAKIKDGRVKGVYATLANLQSAHPTGDSDIYVVTSDGKWYYWNNSVWTAGGVYQGIGIPEKSVGLHETKYSMVGGVPSPNLFDGEVESGGFKYSDGSKFESTDRYRTKNLIKVDLGSQITIQTFAGSKVHLGIFLEYDINKNVIRDDFVNATKKTVQLRPNTAYINLVSCVQDGTYTLPSLTEFANMIVVTQGTGVDEYISPYPKASTDSLLDGVVTKEKLGNVFYQSVTPNFEQGDLTPAGIDEISAQSDRRIRSAPFYANPLTRLTVDPSVQTYVHYFDLINNTVKLGDSGGWVTGDITIPYECNVRILAVYAVDYSVGSSPPVLFTTVADLASKISVSNFVNYSAPTIETEIPTNVPTHAEVLLSRIGLKRVAHRGYSSVAPENTIPAVVEAGNANFWGCECDAVKSSDGVWFLMHDTTVDRTTNGTGLVSNMTSTQIKELIIDAGPNIGNYPNLKVPTFKEYLLACKKHNLVPIIHVDSGSVVDETLVNDVISSGLINKTIFITYYRHVIETLKSIDSRVITQILTTGAESAEEQIKTKIDYIATVKNNAGIGVFYEYLTQPIIDYAHTKNVVVSTFTLNDSTIADTLIDYGLDMITTDELI